MNKDPILVARGLSRHYDQGDDSAVSVLKAIDLDIVRGEKLAIVGVSGSGKTTLLNLLGGLDDATAGSVTLCGKTWCALNHSQRAAWRNRHVGFVYQFHHLLGEFSALENVALPAIISGASSATAKQMAVQLLNRVGLSERLHYYPPQLSGGERQRVAIARALTNHPSLVLMDEPTGNLDPQTAASVLDLLIELNTELGICLVVVTHDPLIANRLDRTVRLTNGVLESAVA